jgi:hypothetical protein
LTDLPPQPEARVILVLPDALAQTRPELLVRRIQSWVESKHTVVWFKVDSFRETGVWAEKRPGQGSLVTADAGMMQRLDSAEAQWRLVNLMRWACRPTALE